MGSMAVVGAGNVGQAIAAHMTSNGHDVRLYSPWEEEFAPVLARGGVELSGDVEGKALPRLMTTDLARAVAGAEVVVVAVPAFAHRGLSEALAGVVEPDQLVLFQPSALGSGLELSRALARAGREPCLIAETGTSLYTCRLRGPAQVFVGRIKPSVKVGATPAAAVGEVQRRLAPFFDDRFSAEVDALTVGLSRIGAVYHVPPALFNFKTVEDGARLPHNTLATPRISALVDELDAERLGLAERLEVKAVSFRDFLERSYGVADGTLSERIQRSYGPLDFPEPDSPSHRYFTEDIPFSMVVWSSLAQQIGHAMPLTDGVIALSGVLCGRDWYSDARTADDLGLAGADSEQIHDAFVHGAR
ncbi:NAD/NADP octopine/nopaline dehydrogenase family protein [Pseudonocardia alni]|uniref:NAD/NADP octopine/nopaline dehydrogenase family protein n=1 Tax=Pseudonocardia alni TaxID=33907 RepID=UPI00280A51C9|nr:NAD/NADP octopine/nopaline dehydrogenase family protein [Pseudonocardia alni]